LRRARKLSKWLWRRTSYTGVTKTFRRAVLQITGSRSGTMRANGERTLRWKYCEFLKDVGMRLKVPQLTIATAIVFCHRFYSRHSVDSSSADLHTVAAACIFLAGKVEETPKSLSDLLKISTIVKYENDVTDKASQLMQETNFVQEQKELILRAERRLLHTLAFDFNIEHPYKYLLSTVKQMQSYQYISEDCTKELAQIAWNFANDSLRTTVCLHPSAKACAYAVIYLATKFMGTKLSLPKDWCSALDMDVDVSEKISNEILDLYESNERHVYDNIKQFSSAAT